MLQVLLALLMVAGGSVEALAATVSATSVPSPAERAPLSEEDESEIEKEGRLEERHVVESTRTDRQGWADLTWVARRTISQSHSDRSLRPGDAGRTPPARC